MTYLERQELNALSKKVFGVSSKWQKLVNKGVPEPMERERKVMIPDHKGGVKEKTFIDKKSVTKHYSVEEVKKFMTDVLEARKPTVVVEQGDGSSVAVEQGQTVDLGGTTLTHE
jgi:hypothetical protein